MLRKTIKLPIPGGMYQKAILKHIKDAVDFLLEENEAFIEEITSAPATQDELYAARIREAISGNPKRG